MEITQINHYEEEHILTDLYNQTNSVSKSK